MNLKYILFVICVFIAMLFIFYGFGTTGNILFMFIAAVFCVAICLLDFKIEENELRRKHPEAWNIKGVDC